MVENKPRINPAVITIDGPAGSGKTTLANRLAQALDYFYLDTGEMDRAVTWAAIHHDLDVNDEKAVIQLAHQIDIVVRPKTVDDGRKTDVLVDGQDVTWAIRQPEVESRVSVVAAYAGVREAMTLKQRVIGSKGRVVMAGRDIGTVVFPDAEVKIYLDASVEERARRRFNQNLARGGSQPYEEILMAMRRRDEIDSTREIAPLRIPPDAVVIDSDGLTIDEVFQKVMTLLGRC
jgi:cytidylate kinase